MAYDSVNALVRNEWFAGEAGGGATTEYLKFRRFQKMRVKAVHAVITVAGTNAGHGLDIYSGTTSVATIALGTAAAGGTGIANTDFDVAALGVISVKTLVDATGKAHVIYEFENVHDGVVSA